jgi:hypothetical protein
LLNVDYLENPMLSVLVTSLEAPWRPFDCFRYPVMSKNI